MPQPSLLGFLQDKDSQRAVGRGLLDAANRGWIAQTFGAPVDMATQAVNLGIAGAGYLGHKAGLFKQPPELLDSARVPGSSEWIGQKMQNAGMVSPNRNPIAEAGMGLLSPVAFKGAQKVGGLLANADMKAAENASKPSTMRMHGQRGAIYARATQQSQSPMNDVPYAMFSDDVAKIEGTYGNNLWAFDDAAPGVSIVDAGARDTQRAIARALLKDRDVLSSYGVDPRALAREANPDRIVDTAGLWDNPELVQLVWDHYLEPNGINSVRTSDGAIVFDRSLISRMRPR